ncbi:unnamed protein product [Sphagnum balticum]
MLLDAFARLTPEEFQRFRNKVISNGLKKGRSRLKQELKVAPEVGFLFQTNVCNFDAFAVRAISSVHLDVVACQGQLSQPRAFALWENPQPLAMRNQDAFKMLDELSDRIVMVEEPSDWLAPL